MKIINNHNKYSFYIDKKSDKKSTAQNSKPFNSFSNIIFGSNPVKIAWLETLPNVSKSVKTQVKEFIPDTVKVHKEIFNIDNTIVNIPHIGSNSMVTKDIMPVTYPHLLLFRPFDNIYSLAEIADKSDFNTDFEATLNLLKKMYPQQDILFFEHGSGSLNYNNQSPKSAGKSVTFAHGHFCVMPEYINNVYLKLLEDTKSILRKNNWENIEENSISGSDVIQLYKRIKHQKKDYPPYIALSYLNKYNEKQSLILLQENKQAATPSQLLRMIVNKFAFNNDDATNWNYKTLLIKAHNGDDYSEYLTKINQVREQDKIFEKRLSQIIKKF